LIEDATLEIRWRFCLSFAPLQLASTFSAFAKNGGFFKKMVDKNGRHAIKMAKQNIRFGISDGKMQAATWKVWTEPKKLDVYLACRELGGELKASLHESGQWHVGYSQKFFQEKVAGSGGHAQRNRFVQEWARPKPLSTQLTLAYRILTPHSAVTSPIGARQGKVSWLPNCPPGKATEIDIFLITGSKPVKDWPGKNGMGTKFVGSYSLPKGDSVWVVYWVTDMPNLFQTRPGHGRFYAGKTKRDLNVDRLRVMAFSKHEPDGSRVIYDLSVEKEQSHDLPNNVKIFRLLK